MVVHPSDLNIRIPLTFTILVLRLLAPCSGKSTIILILSTDVSHPFPLVIH